MQNKWLLLFLTIVSLAISIQAFGERNFADEQRDDILLAKLRSFLQRSYDDIYLSKRKTQAGLDNPELLAECQLECAYLRVDSTDPALRQPYKSCRDECVDRKLG